ncbi:hypothetical protein [Arthrobacter sp. zg-Y1143]|uniref:hypothetical protein n=1 Tax=Arthrobacter sp. zg-Y1143 TaxID=3049065 RepID=UPI0024C3A589|nr:hypothetical protein [Arthrobacter sp. zg-Y1143]MDK1327739.1 hypothetical protein [Arthrobacter sp. zg-Y1143]
MKKSYGLPALPVLALSLALSTALSVCGQDSRDDPAEVRSDVRAAFAEYQSAAAKAAKTMNENFDAYEAKFQDALSPEEMTKFKTGDYDTVEENYDALKPESQKALADFHAEFNPMSGSYHWEGMSDSDRAIIGYNSMLITAFTDENDAKAAADIADEDIMVIDARHAVIMYEDPDHDASTTSRDVFMVKVGKDWKIDGAKEFEDYVKPKEG